MSEALETASFGPEVPDGPSDADRRKLLVAATGAAGGVAIAMSSVPFIASMAPSERARAAGAPVEADITRLAPGEQMTVEWRGKPVWILHRTKAMLMTLRDPRHLAKLADPKSEATSQQPAYAQNAYRSIKEDHLVVVAICTHLGCVPTFRPTVGAKDLGAEWDGGYFCPCHGSRFDFAGRVYRNVPAPTNLVVPPHHYVGATRLKLGEHPDDNARAGLDPGRTYDDAA